MRLSFVSIAGAAAIAWLATAASAADVAGQATYRRYCSACHGLDGRGDGVVSGLMTPRPTDLTQLARANGGTFPLLKVMKSIDGRDRIPAHGETDMPVWGEVFDRDRGQHMAAEAETRGRVHEIAISLQSIQAK
ncbi:MAG: c-type cytochrome [Candidatus Binatia bacterium]